MNRRQTLQKELVLQTVLASCKHPNAEEVYQTIARQYSTVSRSTVYRNLHNLVDEGKIRVVKVTDGPEHFDRTLPMHYHIQCSVCHRVDDVTLEGMGERIMDASGYLVKGRDVIYQGVCPECQKKTCGKQEGE